MVERGEFVEHAEYAGNLYGTSEAALREPLDQGFDLMIEIEVQGARQLRDRLPDARFLFLLPPSMAELERRLRARGRDDDEAIEHRLALVDRELAAVSGGYFRSRKQRSKLGPAAEPDVSAELWRRTVEWVGVDFPAP